MPRAAVLLTAVLTLCLQGLASADPRSINAVIGDASAPTPIADETTRIQTHLWFVLATLRERDTSTLAPDPRARRSKALAALERYIERAEFPRRTDDAYVGRRPRFIDDRGVPCAVGYLLLESGATELARFLDAEYEYAYIDEMDVAALGEWAVAHGFSTVELAMIQPKYGPVFHDESRMRHMLETRSDQLVLTCAREGTPIAQVELRLVADKKGPKSATATQQGAFAKCLERILSQPIRGNSRYGVVARPYDFTITLDLRSPQQIFEEVVGLVRSQCVPRPGPIPHEATIEVTTTAKAQAIDVVTSPKNAEVAACIAADHRDILKRFEGIGGLQAKKTVPVPPRFEAKAFEREVQMNALGFARACRPKTAVPKTITVTVVGKVDAKELDVSVSTKNKAFSSCIATRMREHFALVFGASRKLEDGSYERYFRIDANVTASHQFELPPE